MYKSLNICDYTPGKEIETRIDALKSKMVRDGISFAVILQNVDLFYFTGTIQKGALIVPADQPALFFVEKSLYRAGIESPLEIIPIKKDKDVGDILRAKGLIKGKCGMEFDVIPVVLFERWKSILEYDNMTDVSMLIKEVRLIKSEFEIAQILKSGKILSHVFEKAKGIIKEGMREIDIDAALIAEMRKMNHQGLLRMRGFNQEMMSGYVTHGYSATIPSGADVPIPGLGLAAAIGQGASINVVQRGVPVIVDFGGGYNGYITDETRIYVAGEMKDVFRKGYDTAREIIEDIMGFVKEGTNATELYERALQRAKKAGIEDYFMGHGEGQVGFLGHGLGLEINEMPVFTSRHKMVLKEGMVFAIEPKFIIPNEGAVGIEVDFIVRKDGLQRVTDSSFDVAYV
jgi:Xaa-Pro dipeptidase